MLKLGLVQENNYTSTNVYDIENETQLIYHALQNTATEGISIVGISLASLLTRNSRY